MRKPSISQKVAGLCLSIAILLAFSTLNPSIASADDNRFAFPQCTWGAWQAWHDYYGKGLPSSVRGNAKDWATQAKAAGMATGTTLKTNSIVVFQPGVRGARAPYGHAAFVIKAYSATSFRVKETNCSTNPNGWSERDVEMCSGISFIYGSSSVAPPAAAPKAKRYYLSKITASNGSWNYKFSKKRSSYVLKIKKSKKSVKVSATRSSKAAKVSWSYNNKTWKSGSSKTVKVAKGRSKNIYFKVKSPGAKARIYKVTVSRKR